MKQFFTLMSFIVAMGTTLASAAEWNARLAAEYLDSRQQAWFDRQKLDQRGADKVCVSCHTGLPYLLARPALRQLLGETGPTHAETTLLDGLRQRATHRDARAVFPAFTKEPLAGQATGVEAVLAALLLSGERKEGRLTPEARAAFERLWTVQLTDGDSKGAWPWFDFGADPFETGASSYFGATLASAAVGMAPMSYAAEPGVGAHIDALKAYFQREHKAQPLHNRLYALWASTKWTELLSRQQIDSIVMETLALQNADGGWSIRALGPWMEHTQGPPLSADSDGYATALAAWALSASNPPSANQKLTAAASWLVRNQDPQTGVWKSSSINKRYPAGSMEEKFMQDDATALAALALVQIEHRDTVDYPNGFRTWRLIKSEYVGPDNKLYATRGGIHHFWANPAAVEGFRSGHFPDGSILVNEIRFAKEGEGVAGKGLFAEGDQRNMDVMVKNDSLYKDSGGWGFETFRGEGKTATLTVETRSKCYACHSTKKSSDFVFSELRK